MHVITGHALTAWVRVKELNHRAQSASLTSEERFCLHAELHHALERFRNAYVEERVRQMATREESSGTWSEGLDAYHFGVSDAIQPRRARILR